MARPREFDEETTAAEITEVFWARGYQGTSMSHLVDATGLNRSSLYNAFGGKRDMFLLALDHYRAGPARQVVEPLVTLRGAEAIRRFLHHLSQFVTSPEACRGCLMVNTALEATEIEAADARVAAHFRLLRRGVQRAWTEALEDAAVPDTLTPREVAEWLVTFVRGALVAAGSGVPVASVIRSISLTGRQLGLT